MSCPTLLHFPARACGVNDGGYVTFWTIPVADVTTIPAVGSGTQTISTDLTLAVGKVWKRHYFKAQTANLKSDSVSEDGTGGYDVTFTAILEAYRDEVLEAIRVHKGQELLLIVEDLNGNKKLVGTLDRPVRLSKDAFDSGTKAVDKPTFTLTFMTQIPLRTHPPIYTGTVAE